MATSITQDEIARMKAQFAAKGGKVEALSIFSSEQLAQARKDKRDDERRHAERHFVTDHAGREFCHNGNGEWL